VQPANDEDILLYSDYGYRFTAAVQHENITGVQFHPEKSHKFGMRLLENFATQR
jgi:glutamine amidotransferase